MGKYEWICVVGSLLVMVAAAVWPQPPLVFEVGAAQSFAQPAPGR